MNTYLYLIFLAGIFTMSSFSENPETRHVKCLIQLSNYSGEGAYCTVSLIDHNDAYTKTMYVLGEDSDWYTDIESWFEFYNQEEHPKIDAITGASMEVGKRKVVQLDLDTTFIDSGYKLRFETAVEDQYYYEKDVEIELKEENFNIKHEGQGYLRYIKLF